MSKRQTGINFFRKHHMGDWAVMTRRKGCSFTDEGVLLNAIDLYWRQGCKGLPAALEDLADAVGCTEQEAKSMLKNTTGYDLYDGLIHWETVKASHAKALATSERSRMAGIASGEARRNIRSTNDERTMNHPSTTSQKPSTITQEPECVSTVEEAIPFRAAKKIRE